MRIVNPYPLYVKSGDSVTLICESAKGTDMKLKWEQKTSNTYSDVSAHQQGFAIEECRTEPIGFSKSMLSRSNMSLSTRGDYRCSYVDGSSSYTITVTVLYSMLILFLFLSSQYYNHFE